MMGCAGVHEVAKEADKDASVVKRPAVGPIPRLQSTDPPVWLRGQLWALLKDCNPQILLSWQADRMLTWLRGQLWALLKDSNPQILLSWQADSGPY